MSADALQETAVGVTLLCTVEPDKYIVNPAKKASVSPNCPSGPTNVPVEDNKELEINPVIYLLAG